jgi:hypothetical protein
LVWPRRTWSQQMAAIRRPLLDSMKSAHATYVIARGLQKADRERIYEDAFLRIAIAVEGFLTDWMIRSLADDATNIRNRVIRAVEKDAVTRFSAGATPELPQRASRVFSPSVTVETSSTRRLTLKDAGILIAPNESALSMRSYADYRRRARGLLSSNRVTPILSLTGYARSSLDLTIKLRHTLAHRSDRASSDLNEVLSSGGLRPQLQRSGTAGGRVTANRIGYYLATVVDGYARECWLLDDLSGFAYQMAPSGPGKRRQICDCAKR